MPIIQQELVSSLQNILSNKIVSLHEQLSEITIIVRPEEILTISEILRDHPKLSFDMLVDLCGVDYSAYGGGANNQGNNRFAAVYHLLSVKHNFRLRVKAYADNDEFPVIDSVVDIWPSVNWFEREAFDLFGIVFSGHPDLRRILTDYGFIGNPFRKDFPISGNLEMRYDAEQKRVIYQPVSIEPREITPRVIREEHYGDTE